MAFLDTVDNTLINEVYDITAEFHLSLAYIDNINTINNITAEFHLSLAYIDNINTINNITAEFHLSLANVTNSSIIPDQTISFSIESVTVINTSSGITPGGIGAESVYISIDTVTNISTVYGIGGIYLTFLKSLYPIVNENIIFPIIIGTNFTVLINTVENINYVPDREVSIENITYKGVLKRRATINRPKNFKFKFSDISFDMFPHPLTGDIPVLYDADSINQSINNIIKTRTYERPFSSYNISSKINELLFELSGALLVNELKNVIFNAIVNSEPRIILYEIKVTNLPEANSVSIQVYYQIRTVDTIEKFETVLTRT